MVILKNNKLAFAFSIYKEAIRLVVVKKMTIEIESSCTYNFYETLNYEILLLTITFTTKMSSTSYKWIYHLKSFYSQKH